MNNNKVLDNIIFKIVFFCAIISFFLFCSCASQNDTEKASMSGDSSFESNKMSAEPDEPKVDESVYDDNRLADENMNSQEDISNNSLSKADNAEKLIIRNNLYIETKSFDDYIFKLERMLIKEGGYIEQQDIYYGYEGRNESKSANYTMRVKKENMLSFEKGIEASDANIFRKEKTVENVTKAYADLDRRVKIIKAKEDRLVELMKKADKIKDLIEIEKELAQLVESREILSSQMLVMDHDVDYAYYNIYVHEVKEYKDVKATNSSFVSDLAYAFKSSITGFVLFIKNAILFLVYNWLVILTIIIIVILIRKFIAKHKSQRFIFMKKREKVAEKEEKNDN